MRHNDTYLRTVMTIIAVALFALVVVIAHDGPTVLPTAQAQGIPDSGAQLNQIIEELQQVQESLNRINQTLRSGDTKVQIYTPPANNRSNR